MRRLEDTQIERYINIYQEWHGLESSTSSADKQRVESLREEMLSMEKLVLAEDIIEIRQVALQKINSA